MRIAIIIGPFLPMPPVLGGAVEKVHLALADAYHAAGHEVTIISRRYRDFPQEEIVHGIRHIRIPSRDRSSGRVRNLAAGLAYSLRAASILPPADVTITNEFFLPLVLPRRKAGKIYVQVGRYPKHQMFLYFRADRLQAVSRTVAKAIAHQTPWLAHKIVTIGYAIPDAYFCPLPEPCRGKTILYVGRLNREKGVELLLEAIVSLRSRGGSDILDGWRLRIIGPHDISQGGSGAGYLSELKSLATSLGSLCEFVGPVFDEAALLREYQGAAVFVYPSLAEFGETFGVAPLEAMAAGCAVIVSSLDCFDDFVEDGVTALRFDHRAQDPGERLASQLERLIVERDLLERIAKAGHNAARRFQTGAIAVRMLADFELLLRGLVLRDEASR